MRLDSIDLALAHIGRALRSGCLRTLLARVTSDHIAHATVIQDHVSLAFLESTRPRRAIRIASMLLAEDTCGAVLQKAISHCSCFVSERRDIATDQVCVVSTTRGGLIVNNIDHAVSFIRRNQQRVLLDGFRIG